jgi:hypothetical protein
MSQLFSDTLMSDWYLDCLWKSEEFTNLLLGVCVHVVR